MNVLKEIEKQISEIKRIDSTNYLDSILTHISRAEYYYFEGAKDENYYNDVVYRSNQAYEGALKEAFKILANKTDEDVLRETPNNIEIYLNSNNVFNDRVLHLFKIYRQEWRNKSTHNHKLFFSNNEAFIALNTVTSFVYLLLNQIQEKLSFNIYERKIKKEAILIHGLKTTNNLNQLSPSEKIIEAIKGFIRLNSEYLSSLKENYKQVEVEGMFHAFISSIFGEMKVVRYPEFELDGYKLIPDFKIRIENVDFIVELKLIRDIKRTIGYSSSFMHAINQTFKFLEISKIERGIVYVVNFDKPDPELSIQEMNRVIENKEYEVITICNK